IELLAAASTTEAVAALVADIKQRHGIKVRPTFAASSTLAKHIAAGAPAHLFLSANLAWTGYLQERGLIAPNGVIDLLGNRLVLLARNSDTGGGFSLAELPKKLGRERLVMGDPAHVPAGRYGRQALGNLNLWADVKDRAVFGASVRNALALLARGQGRYAIAYGTDARVYDDLQQRAVFPGTSHDPIIYPLAIIHGQDNDTARKVFRYLQSEQAGKIFQQFGFTYPPRHR
ncbi:MAG: molybdate ABC transporter substrate-binding protein, partial [Rhodospirillaceae bacterium]|nr:molybdate ABC transporter substrate-binding protein [Rhodospirillaceae bacterium]